MFYFTVHKLIFIMKIRMKFLSILCLFLVAFTNSQKIEWLNETSHDFGLIEPDKPVFIEFQYKNISHEPLTVDNVRTTCGCTTPEWTYEEVILPDSIGIIKLEYDAKKPGPFKKLVRVFFSNQKKGEKLIIEGEVMEDE